MNSGIRDAQNLGWKLASVLRGDLGEKLLDTYEMERKPHAAALIQMAVSRSREYQADESGAYLGHDPEALASALQKIEAYAKQTPPATMSPSQAHLFIINPFSGKSTGMMMANLFSTHPPTEQRVARLEELRREMREKGEAVR